MLEYIYFVKCPGCEDEHFSFFNDAKDFAMGCLSQKPIITQIEVDRNDFGECVDSCDLGTVWSWEEMMETEDEPIESVTKSIFTRDDLKQFDPDNDPEFASLDNPVDFTTEEDSFSNLDDVIDFLVEDEEEAIAGYEKVEDAVEDFDVENKKEISDTLNHIKAEEEEHIKELEALLDSSVDEAFNENSFELMRNKREDRAEFDEETGEWILVDYDDNGTPFNKLSRKPIPEGMTIKQIVEEMEDNEDTVECTRCGELFDKASCHHNKEGLGWCCSKCESVDALAEASDRPLYIIKDRNGNQLSSPNTDDSELWDRVESLDPNGRRGLMVVAYTGSRVDESFNPIKEVEFNYDDLAVTLQGPKRAVDDWDEKEDIVSHSIYKKQRDVATDIWENFIEEEDVAPHTLEDLNDDRLWDDFLATHFDELLDKYYDKLLDYYRDDARSDYEANNVLESVKLKSFLEELEEPEDYRKHLIDCPECGVSESFDRGTGFCINCGFNI